MTRSLVREHLFKLLFRIEFNSPEEMPEQVRLFFEDGIAESEDGYDSTGSDIPEDDRKYISDKYERILSHLPDRPGGKGMEHFAYRKGGTVGSSSCGI